VGGEKEQGVGEGGTWTGRKGVADVNDDDRDTFERASEDHGTQPKDCVRAEIRSKVRKDSPKGRVGTAPHNGEATSLAHSNASLPPSVKKARVKKDRSGRLTRAVGATILKPLDGRTWDDVGNELRDMADFAFRAMNFVGLECLKAMGVDSDVSLETRTYRWVGVYLTQHRAYWASKSASHWADDKADAAQHKARSADTIARRAALNVPSCVLVALSRLAHQKHQGWRKTSAMGDKRPPWMNHGHPIVWGVGWSLEKDEKGYALSLKMCRQHQACLMKASCLCKPTRFALRIDGGNAHAQFRRMTTDPDVKLGNVQVFYDDRKRDWSVRISYDAPIPPPASLDVSKALVVHRGMREFLTLATVDGVVLRGSDLHGSKGWAKVTTTGLAGTIAGAKKQFHRRRRDLQMKKRAAPRLGRGWWHSTKLYRELEDTEARFVKTTCQQVAARVVSFAVANGCGRIVIDDWSARQAAWDADRSGQAYLAMLVRRWPFAMQREAIEWAAAKAGITVQAVPAAYESQRCPLCKLSDPKSDRGDGMFVCTGCDLRYGVDAVAAWNMAEAAGAPGAFEAYDQKIKAAVVAMKVAKKEKANEHDR
jgi:IS605 OrfB family transposase